MAEDNRLGITITATDENATATIKSLESTLRGFERALVDYTARQTALGNLLYEPIQKTIASFNVQIAAIKSEIALLVSQTAAINTATAAVEKQTAALREQGAVAERTANEISRSQKKIIDTYLAITGGQLRQAVPLGALRAALPNMLTAEYEAALLELNRKSYGSLKRSKDEGAITEADMAAAVNIGGKQRTLFSVNRLPKQELLQATEAATAATVAEAKLAMDTARATAELEAQGAALTHLTNAQIFSLSNRQRGITEKPTSARESASAFAGGLTPAEIALGMTEASVAAAAAVEKATLADKTAEKIIRANSAPVAAAATAARATVAGHTPEEVKAVGAFAAAEALRRQEVATKAVAAAEAAAGAAGASAEEITAAGISAATEAFRMQKSAIDEARIASNYINADSNRAHTQMLKDAAEENAAYNAKYDNSRRLAELENSYANARYALMRKTADSENADYNAKYDNSRRLADLENADINTRYDTMRKTADSENADYNAKYRNAIRLADLENADINTRYDNMRKMAEAENADVNARYDNAFRLASLENNANDARRAAMLKDAAEENAEYNARYDYARRLAEIENAAILRREAAAKKSAAGIIAAHSPASAAAAAAGAAISRGAAPEEAAIIGANAAVEALLRQEMAAKAVAAAEAAAAKAGADAGEVAAAGARAATRAFDEQAAAATRAGMASARATRIGGARSDGEADEAAKDAKGINWSLQMRHGVAAVDELARGQRGALFGTIGAAARDAGIGVSSLATSMAALMAVMGAMALLNEVESLGKWATEIRAGASAAGMSVQEYSGLRAVLESVGQRGDEADASLRHIGITLNTALADPASRAAEAIHNMGIRQEDLVKNGSNVIGFVHLLADAFARTNDSANKTANMAEIVGRGLEKIIPVIQDGSAALDENIAAQKELGRVIDEESSIALQSMGKHITEVGENIRSGAIPAFIAWKPVIEGTVDVLGSLAAKLLSVISNIGKAITAVSDVVAVMSSMSVKDLIAAGVSYGEAHSEEAIFPSGAPSSGAPSSAKPPPNVTPNIPPLYGFMQKQKADVPALASPVTPMEAMRLQVSAAEKAASDAALATHKTSQQAHEDESRAAIAIIQKRLEADKQALGSERMTVLERTELQKELQDKQLTLNNELIADNNRKDRSSGAASRQSYADFAAGERLKISEAQGSASQIIAIYKNWASQAAGIYKQQANVVLGIQREETEAVNKAKLQELRTSEKQTEDANTLALLNAHLAELQSGRAVTKQSGPQQDLAEAQQYRDEAKGIEQTAQTAIAARQAIVNAAAQGSDSQREAANEITAILIKSKEEEVSLYEKAAAATKSALEKQSQAFTSFFNSVGSQFETFSGSLIKALIAPQQEVIHQGLTTIKKSLQGNEIRQAFASMFIGIAQDLGKSVETAIGHTIAQALSGGAANSIGDLLGNWLSKAFSSITGNALGGVVGGAGGAAVLATAGTTLNAASVTLGTAAGGLITAGVVLTSAATAMAASSGGSSLGLLSLGSVALAMSGGGIVPSAAGGMVSGMGATLSLLHAKEMVLPAHLSEGIQNMISGKGSVNNSANMNYAPTINTSPRGRGGTGMTRAEFSQIMAMHSGAMLGDVRNMMRNGVRLPQWVSA